MPALICDMDGVLIDSYEPHFESWRISTEKRGYQLNRDRFKNLFGKPFATWAAVLTDNTIDQAAMQAWYEEKETLYREMISAAPPFMPGVDALLQRFDAAGFSIGIASAGPRGNVELVHQRLSEGHRVRAAFSADDVERPKPAPDVFLACAAALGHQPADCIVIEDSVHGLEAAKAAGMYRIALTGTATADVLAKHADLVVEHLDEIQPKFIEAVLSDLMN